MNEVTVIAVDGPAASGKSTVSQLVADALGFLLLDTGCMYRAVTLAVLQAGVDVKAETAVTQLAQQIEMEIEPKGEKEDGRQYTVLLRGQDVTWDIRSPEVDENVSQISSYLGVRQEMVRRQRLIGQRGHIVMVGRDIGTVVMPDAPLKIYITATAEERARRRWQDHQKQGLESDYEEILADMKRRDEIDSNREHSPLRPADDAIIIDSTNLTIAETVQQILQLAANRNS